MTKITLLSLAAIAWLGTAYAAEENKADHISGEALLKEDEAAIDSLKAQKDELEKAGGDVSIVESLIVLAEEMKELNNKRHAMHEASRSYNAAMEIFLNDIKAIIQKNNEVIKNQAEAAIKNSKAIALLKPTTPGEEKEEEPEEKNTEAAG